MTKQNRERKRIIAYAVELLEDGYVPSAIPEILMDEYSLSLAQAREIAAKASKQFKKGAKGTVGRS